MKAKNLSLVCLLPCETTGNDSVQSAKFSTIAGLLEKIKMLSLTERNISLIINATFHTLRSYTDPAIKVNKRERNADC